MYKNTIYSVFILLFSFFFGHCFSQSNDGEVRGRVIDSVTNAPLDMANIILMSGETVINGCYSEPDGYYIIKPVPPGTYNIRISFVGYGTKEIQHVIVGQNKATELDAALTHTTLKLFTVSEYRNKLIDKYQVQTATTYDAEELKDSPTRTVNEKVSTTSGVFQADDGKSLNIRGARDDGTQYLVDGIKIVGPFTIPYSAIDQITVLTGGVPAQFGDATGGIIVITTKSYWSH